MSMRGFPLDIRLSYRKARRKPPKDLTKVEEIRPALDAHDAIQAESDAIRPRAGLPPLKETATARFWRSRLEEGEAA